ncbi:MAG: TonB-dependent receptor [Myxococcales bacterium]|nr:TonB-dependent receptor [Myxococcales bacterium]
MSASRLAGPRAPYDARAAFFAWVAALLLLALAPAGPVGAQPEGAPEAAPGGAPEAAPGEAPPKPVPPRLKEAAELSLPPGTEVPEGGVDVLLAIDAEGDVVQAELATAVADPALAAALLEAARALRFEPARRGDRAIGSRIRFHFALELAPPPPPAEPEAPGPSAAAGAPPPPDPATEDQADEEQDAGDYVLGARARVDKPQPGAATQVRLRGEELTMVPGTFGEPLRVVATLPGVARSPFGLGFFAVRGASFQNTGFLVDGFPVPLLYHLGAGPAIISSRLVDRLDFFAGGYPVSYGRFTAGVIALTTAPPPTDDFHLEFEVDLLRASALTVVPFGDGRGSVALAYRRSYYELILPLITDDVQLSYSDYQLRLDYRLTPKLRVSLFVFGSRDALEFSASSGTGETQADSQTGLFYSFDRVIVGLDYRANREWKLRWSATAGPTRVDFGREDATDPSFGVDTRSLRLGQRAEAIYSPGKRLQTTLGVEQNVWLNDVEGTAPSFGELPAIPAPGNDRQPLQFESQLSELSVAPYLEQVVRPGPLEWVLGLRAERLRYGDVSTWLLDPRTVLRAKLREQLTLKAGSGLFGQPPIPFQLTRTYGNPALSPSRALQNSVGAELKLPFHLEIDTTLFYNLMWQLPRNSSRPQTDDEGNPVLSFVRDDGEGRAYGWELLLRRRAQEGLFGWLSYTLSRSERYLEGGKKQPFIFDQTHVLNLAASYKLGAYRFGARYTLASGRPTSDFRADPDGANLVYDLDADEFISDPSGKSTRLPTFHQLDLRFDREVALGPFDGSVFLDIINAYNAQNAEGYLYEYDFSRRAALPGLPFLPTIGIRGQLR